MYCSIIACLFFQRSQHKPAPHSHRPPQDSSGGPQSKKHPGDHAPQRSNELKRPADGVGSSHVGPGGKIARMDRAYSGSSSHSGGRHSGNGDGHDPRRSSFSHLERTGGSNKDRSRDGYGTFCCIYCHLRCFSGDRRKRAFRQLGIMPRVYLLKVGFYLNRSEI